MLSLFHINKRSLNKHFDDLQHQLLSLFHINKCSLNKHLDDLQHQLLSLFHINKCSLNKHFDDLQYLFWVAPIFFNIIAKSETRIPKQVPLLKNLNLNNYSFTLTDTSAGGTLLYIANHVTCKCCNDLNIYKKNELESTFVEIVNLGKSHIIVRVIYWHPSMDLTDLFVIT